MKKALCDRILLTIAVCLVFFSACQNKVSDDSTVIETLLSDVPYEEMFQRTVSCDYLLPENSPNVLISMVGYEPEDVKKVVFTGPKMGDVFTVIDADSRETVYEGIVCGSGSDGYTYGDFSEVTKSGTYYIETGAYGRSYDFEIADSVYSDDYYAALASLSSNDLFADYELGSAAVLNIVMAYDLNPEMYDTGSSVLAWISDEMDDVLYQFETDDSMIENIDTCDMLSLITSFSRFSGIYRNIDAGMADMYMLTAEQMYQCIDSDDIMTSEYKVYWYMANAQLFRVTGKQKYLNVTEECIENGVRSSASEGINPLFWGDYAYLTTPALSTKDICFDIISEMMEQSTYCCDVTSQSRFYECTDCDGAEDYLSTCFEILDNMRMITYTNYVITNSEYRTALHNNYHYLMGLNTDSIMLWDEINNLPDEEKLYVESVLFVVLSDIDNYYDGSY